MLSTERKRGLQMREGESVVTQIFCKVRQVVVRCPPTSKPLPPNEVKRGLGKRPPGTPGLPKSGGAAKQQCRAG